MIKDDKKRTHIIVTGKGGGSDAGAVRFDEAQVLTEEEKTQARNNIGAADVNDIPTATSDLDNDSGFITINDVPAQVNADWNAVSGVAEILNKPTILTEWFGTQAEYDLIDPKDPNTVYHIEGGQPVQSDWNEADNTSLAYIQNKPTIPAAQVQSDWNQSDNTQVDYIKNKPSIPANTSDLNNDSGFITINDVPAQVNADWNSNSGASQILNKPTIPTVPPMATETLTFTLQGGTTKTVDFYIKPMSANYFFVQDLSGNGSTFTIQVFDGDTPTFDVYTSTDQQNWTLFGTVGPFANLQTPVPANGRLYIKAITDHWGQDELIYCTQNYAIGGNIMSLLYGDNFASQTAVPTPLEPEYYDGMVKFGNWQSENYLISAANLVLPATTLVDNCYKNMFNGCTSLTTAPALPATTLAQYCYQGMFYGCTSLTTAPALPATTLIQNCYNQMFSGCTNLNKVTIYADDISWTGALTNWLNNVAATGDLYNLGSATYPTGSASGIPTGWTEHTSL